MKLRFLLIIPVIAVVSCTKFLDQEPVSAAADETTWKTDDDANSAVAGCYALTRAALDASVSYYAYGDLPSDEFGNVDDWDFLQIRNVNWSISVSNLNTYDPKLKLRVYTPFYSAIQQSNRCLHFLSEMPVSAFYDAGKGQEAQRNKYLAEARFIRAFNYFYMARVWGDVPLDTSYQADISGFTGIARTPQNEILDVAISDLNIAKKYLDWKDPASSDRVVRADKGTVFALLAHIYAWKGKYDSCKMACDSVINSGSYYLLPGNSYASIYDGQSDESIFEIAQNGTTEGMNATAYSASIANYTLCAPYIPFITRPNWQISETTFKQLYNDTADVRLKMFKTINSGTEIFYSCIKYANLEKISTSNSGDYYILRNNIIIFRLADILLLKAEALAAQPAPDYNGALNLVNEVRTRAGISPVTSAIGQDALIDTVTAERGRELFLEGNRFYDLVRNMRLTGQSHFINSDGGQSISAAEFQQGKYYWPLDPSLFQLNPSLVQTPFWRTLLTH